MVAFDIIITTIESLILSGFILATFNLFQEKKAFIFLAVLYIIETFFFNNFLVNNFMLLITELMTTVAILYHYYKKITFMYFLVTCSGIALILISNSLSIMIVSNIMDLPISSISSNTTFFIGATCLSKVINFFLWLPTLKFFKWSDNSLLLQKWWLFLIFLSQILILIIVLIEGILFNKCTDKLLLFLIIGLILLLVTSIGIYYKINSDNNEQLELTKKVLRNEYLNKNYVKINYLYNRTIEERHKMMYLLIKLQNLLNNCQYEELRDIIDKEINNANSLQIIKPTSNPYFDFRIYEKLNTIKQIGFNIKTVFQLSEVSALTYENVVDDILHSIDWIIQYSNSTQRLSIFITQKKSYLLIEMETNINTENIINEIDLKTDYIKSKIIINDNLLMVNLLIPIE